MKLSALILFIVIPSITLFYVYDSLALQESESWMNIYAGANVDDRPVGFSHTKIKVNDGKVIAYEESEIKVKAFETENTVSTRAKYVIENGLISSFEYSLESYPNHYIINGKKEDGKLKIQTKTQASSSSRYFDYDDNFIIPPLLPSWLSDGRLKEGEKYSIYLFDPFFFVSNFPKEKFRAEITVMGREKINIDSVEYSAYRVGFNYLNNDSEFWIDDNGNIIKEIIPPGFVSLKTKIDNIKADNIKSYDVVDKTSIKSPVNITDARDKKYMKFDIYDLEGNNLDIADGYSQFAIDSHMVIKSADTKKLHHEKIATESFDKYLQPTNFIQSDNEKIISKQLSITGGNHDKIEGIKKINSWVYKKIEKTPVFSVPDSLEVLSSMKGDCNEHAVLFAALSRSYGVPTKIAIGLVYLDGRFYYHAWNEVYLGKWVTVDPALGQFPADATHIKLTEGGIEKSVEIIKLAGKLNIDILEVY